MAISRIYQPEYSDSYALVIGIDEYGYVSPLVHAANDAVAIAAALIDYFGFEESKVVLLTNAEATRAAILENFLRFANPELDTNARLVVFFAGHGHTVSSYRGEIGFLIPADGRVDDLSTLIRWDELTRNADLVPAKHVLFIMDACYGGLALSRRPLPAGSVRFVRDMLQRFTRQVLAAGKPDEPVADGGGPRSGHSMLTGHILEALEGAAATTDGIITANGVMAYVYSQVSQDPNSRQTPHYGFIDGDGDLIFNVAELENFASDKEGKDLIISIPQGTLHVEDQASLADVLKRMIPDPKDRINLDDLTTSRVRRTIDTLRLEQFPVQGIPCNAIEFPKRIKQFDNAIVDAETVVILLARWAESHHLPVLEKVIVRLGEAEKGSAGYTAWIAAAWYPVLRLLYAGGIAALSADNYDALRTILLCRVSRHESTGGYAVPILQVAIDSLTEIHDSFKTMPGHERHYAPRSEYIFTTLQPNVEDLLFVGRTYEGLFDRFEIIMALTYADIRQASGYDGNVWGPPGRFAWKHRRGSGTNPFGELVKEATQAGDAWGPLRAGLFGGKITRFLSISEAYRELLGRLSWW